MNRVQTEGAQPKGLNLAIDQMALSMTYFFWWIATRLLSPSSRGAETISHWDCSYLLNLVNNTLTECLRLCISP